MNTKLTLKVNKEIIKKAKKYATDRKTSLSKIIENYLQLLTKSHNQEEIKISPFVKSLSIKNKIPKDLDYKKEFSKHIEKKYK